MITIQRYDPSNHYDQLVNCLQELIDSHSSYPPKNVLTGVVLSAVDWLADEGVDSQRFVAVLEGRVVGHIGITALHDYMVEYFTENALIQNDTERRSYAEIGTFFVAPSAQKHGTGGKLFKHALKEVYLLSKVPALAVVESHDSHKATNLYEKNGMMKVGHFNGSHGKNLIFIKKY